MGDEARIHPILYAISSLVLRPLFRTVYRLRRGGGHNVPATGPVLFVSNHVSGMDPPLLGAGALPRRLHFMAKKELFAHPVASWIISRVGAFPVDRGAVNEPISRPSGPDPGRGPPQLLRRAPAHGCASDHLREGRNEIICGNLAERFRHGAEIGEEQCARFAIFAAPQALGAGFFIVCCNVFGDPNER